MVQTMAWFMIAGMHHQWPAIIERLAELDRSKAFAELDVALQALPGDVPDVHRALLAHWRGKVALLNEAIADAIPQLALAASLDTDHAANHYLLGAALVRQQQWLDARTCLERAVQLRPDLAAARLELATVYLALAEPEQSMVLLAPLNDSPSGLLRARRAQSNVLGTSDLGVAAASAAAALSLSSRLPESLLLEWLQLTGGLLLAGHLADARAWLLALTTITPAVAATANPLPRRVALIALLALDLIEPANPDLSAWSLELRGLRWLPASASEHSIWTSWLEPWLMVVAGRLEAMPDRDANRCSSALKVIIAVLPALEPPKTQNFGLFLRLEQLRQGIQPDQAIGDSQHKLALNRHGHDHQSVLGSLERCCNLNDRKLADLRAILEHQLNRFSDSMLCIPQLLTLHPAAGLLNESLQLRQVMLDCLLATRRRLAVCLDALPQQQRDLRHWLLLASEDLPQCVLFRVEQKRQQLEALGCVVRIVWREQLVYWNWSDALLWAHAVIVCRLPATVHVLRAIEACRLAGLPTWYDLDDLVVDPLHGVPPLATYGGTITPQQHRLLQLDVPLFAEAMRACDAAIVSTSTLARRWHELQPDQPVQVLANLAPPELRAFLQTPRRLGRRPRLVVASGTKAHKQIWIEELAPALALLLERNPELQLDLLGHLQLPLVLQIYKSRIRCHPFRDYSKYLQLLGEADIGLVALEPGLYTDAKSAIRWMEFSYLGLASVLSPTRTYTELLEDGVHTRFAEGIQQWVNTVELLLADPGGTQAMASRAQKRAQDLFGPDQGERFWRPLIGPETTSTAPGKQVAKWTKFLRRLIGPKPTSIAVGKQVAKRKILVLNVYFAPQSVGGATRIAQDQVRAICGQLGDQWEVTVLCTETDPYMGVSEPVFSEVEAPFPIQVHQWHGARVVRVSLPGRVWSRHHDGNIEAFCRRWFPQEGFDLVHCHCIQVLGVGPLLVAQELGIPYVVTLHDGWWLSPRQFLTTVSGRLIDGRDPLGHVDVLAALDEEQQQEAKDRRVALDAVLAGAAARLAVSDPFAEVLRAAGIEAVSVMENRWQPMPSASPRRRRPADQPLRCCYIGGVAIHKGMHVVQAALLQAEPVSPGLELTVVDSSLQSDEEVLMRWGQTPVRVIPSVPMTAMAEFYAEQDVLLAPSIWPESYGLVSREALSAGLWVVASDIGAMADPIRHGENGHRVPAGDATALAVVLEQLAAQHPSPQPLIAFGGEQPPLHAELNQLYGGVLKG